MPETGEDWRKWAMSLADGVSRKQYRRISNICDSQGGRVYEDYTFSGKEDE